LSQSFDNHLNKSSDHSLLFTQWFLKNDLWDKWNLELKNYYREKCLNLAEQYSLSKWLDNFYGILY